MPEVATSLRAVFTVVFACLPVSITGRQILRWDGGVFVADSDHCRDADGAALAACKVFKLI
ncbi:MAG: hypothetical protein HHJ17_03295 [Rhodoferax sp.]|uniref:hypothetical protein n=1 Tax=Rhodoferax sp. TaxID=50421 RepID=UPI0017AE9702|nr:hypothetical protein [Rhodoferax sp.]NMM12556.1 hypothetical protein [Rhodoferax sp.]NMM21739.1 hypothetical protein [Rhodoferax sp.]